MKNVICIKLTLSALLVTLTACQRPNLSNSPSPQEIITDPVYQDQVKKINKDREQKGLSTLEELVKRGDYEEKFNNPYVAAELGYIDEVIEPSQTRERLIAEI